MATTNATPILTTWLRNCFLPYQLKWTLEPKRFALSVKGRQIGFTDATAAGCILGGFRDRRPQIVISASQKNANELLNAVKNHCAFLAGIGLKAATDYTVCNTEMVSWRSGGSVMALAASPRTSRSFHGDLWLDEFAYHQDAEGLWKAAFPMATRHDWRIRVFSTPNGATGLFHEFCDKVPMGWAFHRVSLDDAERDGLKVDRAALLSLANGDERAFAEAYQCAFLDADLQYLPSAIVTPALAWKGAAPDLSHADIYGGLDVGRVNDLTVLTPGAEVVGRQDVAVAYLVKTLTAKRTAFRAQRRMIFDAHELLDFQRLAVDATGLGAQLAEELSEAFGEDVVEQVNFSAEVKADLATRAFRWLRDGRVRFTRDAAGKTLHDECIALRRKVSDAGNIQYVSPRTAAGHGDHFWSMALMLRAMDRGQAPRGLGDSMMGHA